MPDKYKWTNKYFYSNNIVKIKPSDIVNKIAKQMNKLGYKTDRFETSYRCHLYIYLPRIDLSFILVGLSYSENTVYFDSGFRDMNINIEAPEFPLSWICLKIGNLPLSETPTSVIIHLLNTILEYASYLYRLDKLEKLKEYIRIAAYCHPETYPSLEEIELDPLKYTIPSHKNIFDTIILKYARYLVQCDN